MAQLGDCVGRWPHGVRVTWAGDVWVGDRVGGWACGWVNRLSCWLQGGLPCELRTQWVGGRVGGWWCEGVIMWTGDRMTCRSVTPWVGDHVGWWPRGGITTSGSDPVGGWPTMWVGDHVVWSVTCLRGLVTAHVGGWPHSWHHELQPISCPRQAAHGRHQPHGEPVLSPHPPGLVPGSTTFAHGCGSSARGQLPAIAKPSQATSSGPSGLLVMSSCDVTSLNRKPPQGWRTARRGSWALRRTHHVRILWRHCAEPEAASGLMDGAQVELRIVEAASRSRPVMRPAWRGSRLGAEGRGTEGLGIAEAAPRSHPVTSLCWTRSCLEADEQRVGGAGYRGACVSVTSCAIAGLNWKLPWGWRTARLGAGPCGGYSQPCPAGLVIRLPVHWMWVTAEAGPGGRVHGLLGPPRVSSLMQGVRRWLKVSAWFIQSHPQGDTPALWLSRRRGWVVPSSWHSEQQTVTPSLGGGGGSMAVAVSFCVCCMFLFSSHLFVRPLQTTTLPVCSSFSCGCFWSPPPVQCWEPPSIGLLVPRVPGLTLESICPFQCILKRDLNKAKNHRNTGEWERLEIASGKLDMPREISYKDRHNKAQKRYGPN